MSSRSGGLQRVPKTAKGTQRNCLDRKNQKDIWNRGRNLVGKGSKFDPHNLLKKMLGMVTLRWKQAKP